MFDDDFWTFNGPLRRKICHRPQCLMTWAYRRIATIR